MSTRLKSHEIHSITLFLDRIILRLAFEGLVSTTVSRTHTLHQLMTGYIMGSSDAC